MRARVSLFLTASSVFVAALAVAAAPAVVPQNAPAPAGQARQGGAGRGGPNAPPKNLKVLPKDWTTRQVGTLMQTFTQSLGVRCDHCHEEDPNAAPPPPGRPPRLDYSLDGKKEKDVARSMIKMVMEINANYASQVGDASMPEKVSCFTCHQGDKKPAFTPVNGWERGGFSLLPAGPPMPPRRGGPGGGPGPGPAPVPPAPPAGN
jgi:hypothetical protein